MRQPAIKTSESISFLQQDKVKDRMEQIKVSILKSDKSFRKYDKNELQKAYEEICSKYSEIRLHRLWSNRIGEYIPRYLVAVEDAEKNDVNGVLDLFVLSSYANYNSRLSEIMGRHIHMIDETNINMWLYILSHFPQVEFDKYWNDYVDRNKDRIIDSYKTAQYFLITEEEKSEGEHKKDLMGLHGSFVCVSSRDSKYLSVIIPTADVKYHDYRDSDINKLRSSSEYLAGKNIAVVRMGRYVQSNVEFDNCIDYANRFYDELMDIILMKDCKFYLGDSNGICALPMTMNRPVALKNVIPISLDIWGAHPQNPQNLYIFKKYYKKDEDRFLSVREMMQVEKKVQYDGRRYAKMGIEVIENSEEEILDLAMEMNERIDGTWMEEAEDIELQKRYENLLEEWCLQEGLKYNAMLHAKVGSLFLRKNLFLLENTDSGD